MSVGQPLGPTPASRQLRPRGGTLTTQLGLQTPTSGATRYLDAILSSAATAKSGGGLFAWATAPGIQAMLSHPTFADFLRRGNYELVVGTDAITTDAAVKSLRRLGEYHSNLHIHAFVHETPSLFHPKLTWFRSGSGLSLLVGSGNLTNGGLVNNWEAYSASELHADEASAVESTLADWFTEHAAQLIDINSPEVDAAVEGNISSFRPRKAHVPTDVVTFPTGEYLPAISETLLVAEIPKNRKDHQGNSQYSQVNFDQATFEDFFDYSSSSPTNTILLLPVTSTGAVGSIESRIARYKPRSSNWYFEIGTTKGLPYPATVGDRPLAIYGRIGNGEYAYLAASPGEPGYAELRALLDSRLPIGQTAGKMRRFTFSDSEVRRFWPSCPLT